MTINRVIVFALTLLWAAFGAAQQVPHAVSHQKSIQETRSDKLVTAWHKPIQGKLKKDFELTHKGINFKGKFGEPVLATAAGKVVYSGNGLRGYGNLVIIEHNSHYLSAYGYNSRLFVRDGEMVKSGQKIAEMGNNMVNKPMLYFEIRKAGKPVNPLSLLKTDV